MAHHAANITSEETGCRSPTETTTAKSSVTSATTAETTAITLNGSGTESVLGPPVQMICSP